MHLWGLVPIDSMKMCYAALARDFSRGGKKRTLLSTSRNDGSQKNILKLLEKKWVCIPSEFPM